MTLYKVAQDVYFLIAEPKMKGNYVNQIVDSLVSQANFSKIVILDNMHKYEYPQIEV